MEKRAKKHILFWVSIAAIFVALRIVMREILHVPYDFMPLMAVALFSPVLLGRNWKAPALMLLIVLASDLILSMTTNGSSPFYAGFYWQYIAYGLTVGLGFIYSQRLNVLNTAIFGLSGAITFFLISNFGVWMTGTLYPMTMHGLMTCFAMGIPFFKSSLLGDLFYSYAFFTLATCLRNQKPMLVNA